MTCMTLLFLFFQSVLDVDGKKSKKAKTSLDMSLWTNCDFLNLFFYYPFSGVWVCHWGDSRWQPPGCGPYRSETATAANLGHRQTDGTAANHKDPWHWWWCELSLGQSCSGGNGRDVWWEVAYAWVDFWAELLRREQERHSVGSAVCIFGWNIA